ncbi:hypothetical protein PM082_020538 [Marasmius tenuissimus]|nr:hypothetical protein PM082_020538 [Marasmius tenuissimus]
MSAFSHLFSCRFDGVQERADGGSESGGVHGGYVALAGRSCKTGCIIDTVCSATINAQSISGHSCDLRYMQFWNVFKSLECGRSTPKGMLV